jgi:hypothetical protein
MLAPPPVAESEHLSAVSFHAISGMYERAEALLEPFDAFQKELALPPSLNSVPPTAVTSGTLAGKMTAGPLMACEPLSQPAAPASPDDATQVIP